ncbi:hypothetical protein Tco_1563333, partial [Tanacetum coccineum]
DESDDDKGNDDDGDNDDNDDDSDDERTESDRDDNPNLNQTKEEHEEEEKEYVDERFEHVKEDAHVPLTAVHDTQKTEGPMQSSSVLFDFTTTPTPTPTASEVTTLFLALPDFSSIFKFNDRVTNLEKDLSKIKQVNRYAQVISSIPAIVDRYIGNKLGESIQRAIKSHTAECRDEALADKREYIDLIDTSVRAIIKEEVNTQLPQILPQAVTDFATPMIEQNVIESLEAAVLAKSSFQPKSTYEAAASLSEFELTKILMDKMEEHKSYLRVEYKNELYDALVKSYNTDKDLFETYGEVFTLKKSRDDNDKDQDPSAGLDQGMKRRKTSKDAESSRDPKSKESKSSSSSTGTFRSQHKSSGKSAHA